MKNAEFTLMLRKGPARGIYTPGMKMVHEFNNPVGNKSHPTEKPVDLVKMFVEASSLPGQTVLDPFAGTGSTGVACRETGRSFIGAEIDPVYFEIAQERLR